MYSFDSRVRYSEVDKNGQLDFVSIVNYFQDCSTFHSEDAGIGIELLEKKHQAWLLNSWQIVVSDYPLLGDYITTTTWAYDFQGIYGYRNFVIKDSSGQLYASANSIWVFMDVEQNRPTRIQPDEVGRYGLDPKFEMDYAPRKIPLPQALTNMSPFPVVPSNIDTNHHVNNGQYIKMAKDYLPEDFIIRQMRAEYKMPAVLGDVITPKLQRNDNIITIVLADNRDKPYTIIEFTGN